MISICLCRAVDGATETPTPESPLLSLTNNVSDISAAKSEAEIGKQMGKNMSKILDSILRGYDARVRPFPENGEL